MSKRGEPFELRLMDHGRVLCIPLLEGETLGTFYTYPIDPGDRFVLMELQLERGTPAQQEPEVMPEQEMSRELPAYAAAQWDRIGILEDHVAKLLAWHKELDEAAAETLARIKDPAQQERGEDRRNPVDIRAAWVAESIPGLCRRTTGERRQGDE